LVIPDTQVKPGVPIDHLGWIGQYMVEKQPDVVIHLGDHWDMPSLSSYDAGKRCFEGRRYVNDVHAGNVGLDALMAPLERYNKHKRALKEKQYRPRLIMLRGNHEQRIERAVNADPKLDGILGYHDFNDISHGFEPVPFLQPITVDGVAYVHFSVLNANGDVMASKFGQANARTQLNREMRTIVTGHKQGLDVANRPAHGKLLWSIIAGSAYLHDEAYLTPQGNHYWRGVVMLNDVRGGEFEPMPLTLAYLCRRYEGMELSEFMEGRHEMAG
jgi:predicted phosphodiesterase